MRIDTPALLPDDLVEDFLKVYRAAFEPLETRAAARQSLTDDEFVEELAHPAVLKWLAWDDDHADGGRPAGMAFVTTDLSIVPWISLPYYQAHFPEHYARKAIYYFGGLLVHPEYQGSSAAAELLEASLGRCAADHAIAAFDCCGFNVEVKHFTDHIAEVCRRVSIECDLQEIDVQRYYAYNLKGRS